MLVHWRDIFQWWRLINIRLFGRIIQVPQVIQADAITQQRVVKLRKRSVHILVITEEWIVSGGRRFICKRINTAAECEIFKIVTASGCCGRLVSICFDFEFIVTQTETAPRYDRFGTVPRHSLAGAIKEHTVGAGVGQKKLTIALFNNAMMTGKKALRVWQTELVVLAPSDGYAVRNDIVHFLLSGSEALITGNPEAYGHEFLAMLEVLNRY
jgi:hypothetical protein